METVKLGDHVLPVVPQRHAYLRKKLQAGDLQKLFTQDSYSSESYRLLSIFIPELPKQIPEFEWEGYASEEAWENDDYNEDLDKSPLTDQIVEAFETALRVSGAGRLGKLLDMVQVGVKLQEQQAQQPTSATPDSPASPGSDGASALTSSGTTSPTTPASEVSPGHE